MSQRRVMIQIDEPEFEMLSELATAEMRSISAMGRIALATGLREILRRINRPVTTADIPQDAMREHVIAEIIRAEASETGEPS